MQIQYLKISKFKLLNDFEIEFNVPDDGDSLTAFVGENGVGKSTVLEAILRIFGSFTSEAVEKEYKFEYTIIYKLACRDIAIEYSNGLCSILIKENNEEIFNKKATINTLKKYIKKENLRILPSRIISLYSGVNDKMLGINNKLEKLFKATWKSNVEKYLDGNNENQEYDLYERKFIHCNDNQVAIYFASLLSNESVCDSDWVLDELCFDGNFKINMELDLNKFKVKLVEEEDDDDTLSGYNILSYNISSSTTYNFSKFFSVIEFILDDYDDNFELLKKHNGSTNVLRYKDNKLFWQLDSSLIKNISSIHIYNMLERLVALFNAKIDVYSNNININDFSEGQRQFIKIFGMLSICKNEECLILMDEPDAHMNPKWKYNIRSYMEKAIEGAINTQILIATHDPLIINGLKKEDIKIFIREDDNVVTREAFNDTSGMGIDGLLRSEYYRLNTSYDKETFNKFQRQNELYIKLIHKDIDDDEKEELRVLSKDIGNLPAMNTSIDFIYSDFISVFKNTKFYKKEYLEFDQLEERRKKIEEIIAGLYEDLP